MPSGAAHPPGIQPNRDNTPCGPKAQAQGRRTLKTGAVCTQVQGLLQFNHRVIAQGVQHLPTVQLMRHPQTAEIAVTVKHG